MRLGENLLGSPSPLPPFTYSNSATEKISQLIKSEFSLPNRFFVMRLFMPGPPDSTSVAFANDVNRYFWGKEMREDQERADQAKRDAVYGLATILVEFEEAFGLKISQEDTPEIYKVLLEGTATCDSICKYPKTR